MHISFLAAAESADLADDIRQLFDDLAARLPHEQRAYSGECHPPLDVLETAEAIQVVVDVCGVPPEALRVLFRAGVLLVAGEKGPGITAPQQSFHLIEREFGRFARAVRLNGAFAISKARATLADGELTVVVPKLPERRGRAHRIAVAAEAGSRPPE